MDSLDEWLVDAGLSGDWADDLLLGKDGLFPDDSLGSVVGVLNWGWLDVGNGCGLVDVGGFGDWVGDGVEGWGHLGESLGSDDTVGEVASESVTLDGCTVVLWGTDEDRACGNWSNGCGGSDDSSVGNSQKASENNEFLEFK